MSHIIPIGNSHGIRIPKTIIQQAGLLGAELSLTVVPEGLLITPIQNRPRAGWEEAFKTAPANTDKSMTKLINKFDTEEWEW